MGPGAGLTANEGDRKAHGSAATRKQRGAGSRAGACRWGAGRCPHEVDLWEERPPSQEPHSEFGWTPPSLRRRPAAPRESAVRKLAAAPCAPCCVTSALPAGTGKLLGRPPARFGPSPGRISWPAANAGPKPAWESPRAPPSAGIPGARSLPLARFSDARCAPRRRRRRRPFAAAVCPSEPPPKSGTRE